MTERKYTSEGLPIVSQATMEVLARDLGARGLEYILQNLRRLVQTNVHAGQFLGIYSDVISKIEGRDDTDFKKGLVMGYLCAYELLRRQAEANKLEKDINES